LDETWPFDLRTAFFYEVEEQFISSIVWTGGSFDGKPPAARTFVLRVYADDDGHPGHVQHEQPISLLDDAELLATGSYAYTATVSPALNLPLFSKVWIEVQSLSTGLPQWGIEQVTSPSASQMRQLKGSIDGLRQWTSCPSEGHQERHPVIGPIDQINVSQPASKVSLCRIVANGDGTASELELVMAAPGHIDVRLFGPSGREVAQPFAGQLELGTTRVQLLSSGGNNARGVYFLQVVLDGQATVLKRKVLLLR